MNVVVSRAMVVSLAVEEKTKLKESNYLIRCLTHEDSLHTGPQQALLQRELVEGGITSSWSPKLWSALLADMIRYLMLGDKLQCQPRQRFLLGHGTALRR